MFGTQFEVVSPAQEVLAQSGSYVFSRVPIISPRMGQGSPRFSLYPFPSPTGHTYSQAGALRSWTVPTEPPHLVAIRAPDPTTHLMLAECSRRTPLRTPRFTITVSEKRAILCEHKYFRVWRSSANILSPMCALSPSLRARPPCRHGVSPLLRR